MKIEPLTDDPPAASAAFDIGPRASIRTTQRDRDHAEVIARHIEAAGFKSTTTLIVRAALQKLAMTLEPKIPMNNPSKRKGKRATPHMRLAPATKTPRAGPSEATVDELGSAIIGKGPYQVFTDGACSGNPGPGGWAAVFVHHGAVVAEFSGGERGSTNNRMEIAAVREALRRAPGAAPLHILTDSNNVIGWLSKGWKRKEPSIAAACGEIGALIRGRSGAVTFEHVKGHAGHAFNERADRLAVAARDDAAKSRAVA